MEKYPDSHTSWEGRGRQFCTACDVSGPHYFCETVNPNDQPLSDAIKHIYDNEPELGRRVHFAITYYRERTPNVHFPEQMIQEMNEAIEHAISVTVRISDQKGEEFRMSLKNIGYITQRDIPKIKEAV